MDRRIIRNLLQGIIQRRRVHVAVRTDGHFVFSLGVVHGVTYAGFSGKDRQPNELDH